MSKKGFTIVELLIVVIIIGILAAISIPQYTKVIQKAKAAEAVTNLGVLRSAIDRYWYEQVATGNAQGLWPSVILNLGRPDGEMNNPLVLDVSNPNNIETREWNYGIEDYCDFEIRYYIIKAYKRTDEGVWVEMNHDGDIAKSISLGGDGVMLDRRPL